MSIIIPIASNDNGKLMTLLESNGFDFTVTSESISDIFKSVYDPEAKASSTSRTSNTAKTVIVNGRNNAIFSKLSTLGYSNYSVTAQMSYFDLIFELFTRLSFLQIETRHLSAPIYCLNEDTSDDDEYYYSARQSPDPVYCNNEDTTFDNENYVEIIDDEPLPKRPKLHYCYPGSYCGCMQQCTICKKHVLGENNFSSTDIITHAFYHSKLYRFQCATCGVGWNIRSKQHKFNCSEKKITDIVKPSNAPSSLITLSLKCFPTAVKDLIERRQWNF